MLLGWRLEPGQDALGAPFWSRGDYWHAWAEDETCPVIVFVWDEDLDRRADRELAVATFLTWRSRRL
jgi:hypothetical protein